MTPLNTLYQKAVAELRARGFSTPELDARLLLAHALGEDPSLLNLHQDHMVEEDGFQALLAERLCGKPVAKIIGYKEFWGLRFKTSLDTLDPRPDSETLVAGVLATVSNRDQPLTILDLGCGTGCLALSLLSELPRAQAVLVDVSPAALAVARENAQAHRFSDRCRFIEADMRSLNLIEQFDLIISNPPYIGRKEYEELDPQVKDFDPPLALVAADEGLEFYKILAANYAAALNIGGILAVEVGHEQAVAVQSIFAGAGWTALKVCEDLAGIPRALFFTK